MQARQYTARQGVHYMQYK